MNGRAITDGSMNSPLFSPKKVRRQRPPFRMPPDKRETREESLILTNYNQLSSDVRPVGPRVGLSLPQAYSNFDWRASKGDIRLFFQSCLSAPGRPSCAIVIFKQRMTRVCVCARKMRMYGEPQPKKTHTPISCTYCERVKARRRIAPSLARPFTTTHTYYIHTKNNQTNTHGITHLHQKSAIRLYR